MTNAFFYLLLFKVTYPQTHMGKGFVTLIFVVGLIFSSPQASAGDGADWFGAGVGTITGFGLGHIFQGRYFFKGFMFTVIDGAGAYLVVEGAVGCVAGAAFTGNCPNSYANNYAEGAAILVVSRLWQIIDLFSYAGSSHSKSSFQLLPLQNQGMELAWNYRF
jgi:hypothetical protein